RRMRLFGPGDAVVANTQIDPGVWTHCAITRTGDTLHLYMNGVEDATGTFTDPFTPKVLGRGNAGYLAGMLDDVRLYDRPLRPRPRAERDPPSRLQLRQWPDRALEARRRLRDRRAGRHGLRPRRRPDRRAHLGKWHRRRGGPLRRRRRLHRHPEPHHLRRL